MGGTHAMRIKEHLAGRSGSLRREKRGVPIPDKRRSHLPKTLAGRKFHYDEKTIVQPVEILPRSSHWNDVPQAQRHTRNYYLRYLTSGVRGRWVFSHECLEELLKGKGEVS